MASWTSGNSSPDVLLAALGRMISSPFLSVLSVLFCKDMADFFFFDDEGFEVLELDRKPFCKPQKFVSSLVAFLFTLVLGGSELGAPSDLLFEVTEADFPWLWDSCEDSGLTLGGKTGLLILHILSNSSVMSSKGGGSSSWSQPGRVIAIFYTSQTAIELLPFMTLHCLPTDGAQVVSSLPGATNFPRNTLNRAHQ